LRFISNKNLHCKLETSNFALAELAQVIRDNIIASKMMRDAQSLVYFPSLKDYYELDEDEHHDLLAYFRQIMELLRTKSVTVRSLKIILSDVSAFSAIYGIDTPDSLHIAWAHERNCDFFVTSDKKLLARLKEANPVFQSIWIINPVQLIPLVNIIRNATSKTEMIKLGKQAIT
jgi:predicted nucleic acid-binding protein